MVQVRSTEIAAIATVVEVMIGSCIRVGEADGMQPRAVEAIAAVALRDT
jgi:hypothetical protein